MKNILSIALVIVCLIGLSACGNQNDKVNKNMYIEPAQLSQTEEDIGELLGLNENRMIYDFVLQDGVQTMKKSTYVLADGKWEVLSSEVGEFKDTKGRIALGFDYIADGVWTATQSENQKGKTSYKPMEAEDLGNLGVATTKLNDKSEIVYDKEIPVALQVMTSKNEIYSESVSGFFEPNKLEEKEYEHVYAITLLFSQKSNAELEKQTEGNQ